MPLPLKVSEKLAYEPSKAPGWSFHLFVFSFSIFLIVVMVYAGLTWGYIPYLNNQIGKLNNQINTFNQQIPASDQKDLINFYSQLINLKKILSSRNLISPALDWLEKNTATNIYYINFGFNSSNWQISLVGAAKTVNDFNQQLQSWENSPAVKKISLNSLAVDNSGLWKFDLIIFLDKNSLTRSSATSSSEIKM